MTISGGATAEKQAEAAINLSKAAWEQARTGREQLTAIRQSSVTSRQVAQAAIRQANASQRAAEAAVEQVKVSALLARASARLPFVEQMIRERTSQRDIADAKSVFVQQLIALEGKALVIEYSMQDVGVLQKDLSSMDNMISNLVYNLRVMQSGQSEITTAFSTSKNIETLNAVGFLIRENSRLAAFAQRILDAANSPSGMSEDTANDINIELEQSRLRIRLAKHLNTIENSATPKPGKIVMSKCLEPGNEWGCTSTENRPWLK